MTVDAMTDRSVVLRASRMSGVGIVCCGRVNSGHWSVASFKADIA